MPSSAIFRLNTVVASGARERGGGSPVGQGSSAGTYTACTEVMEPRLVEVMRPAWRPFPWPAWAGNLRRWAYGPAARTLRNPPA